MSKKRSKLSSNPLKVELIHMSLNDSNGYDNECQPKPQTETVVKDLKQKMRKVLSISSVKLEAFEIKDNSSEKVYFEDNRVFRFNAEIECERHDINGIKKSLADICKEDQLRNTFFALNCETIEGLSQIHRFIPHQTIRLNKFSFGTLIDLTQFVEHYSSYSDGYELNVAKDDITADFQHDKKRLQLKFRLTSGGIHGKHTQVMNYRLEYEYSCINSAVVWVDGNVMRIYFSLNHPPILSRVEKSEESGDENFVNNNNNKYYKNKNKIKMYKNSDTKAAVHTNEVSNNAFWLRENEFKGCEPETIGKSNVIMIEIKQIEKVKCLEERYSDDRIPDPWRLLYIMKRFVKIQIHFANISHHKSVDNKDIKLKLIDKISVPFPVKYAFHSVFSHTFQSSDELFLKVEFNEFNRIVKEYEEINSEAIVEALFELSALIDRNAIFCTINALKAIFSYCKIRNEKLEKEKINVKSFKTEIEFIRRCILTPTRFLVLPPQPTLKSRFIVNSDPEFTIRLSVREDDLQGLSYSVRGSGSKVSQSKFLKKVIKTPLMEGIRVGGRLFEFLGSSSSQLRESGMILYTKDKEGRTAASIRESIGDMSKIRRNVAKYVARLGLAFSQVMTHIVIDESITKIEVIPDILGPFKPNSENSSELTEERYIFSDGIGRISSELMKRVYEKLTTECENKPSAMQIRYGGCKGMLTIDPNLKGEHIIFRDSMKKYDSNDRMLGIIKLSRPRPLYLNRPLITILEQLGVEPKVFLKMLMKNLTNLTNSLICECYAISLFQDASTLGIPYSKLYKSGIQFLSEPIFRQMLDCLINHRIIELKTKARIKVPMNCGRTVFGVLDETKSLNYGEVFVQLSHVDEEYMPKETFILKDEIMVTKFPCLHPGDVRKLKAVDIPALYHIKDCIVFPAKGHRPHPDEMAGSDLDGDEYAVIWNSDLIFEGNNKNPMLFPTSKAKPLSKDATVEDILDFYCDYILSNNVGLLASAHLANADFLREGIFGEICMSLTKKYAIALDFAKTGKVEPMHWTERPSIYPDFMEKFSEKRTYLSNKVLGQLYRHCDRFEMGMQSKADLEITAEANEMFKLKGWEKYKDSAINAFKEYTEKIKFLLNRFGVESEAALLSGAFSKTSKHMTGRNETNDVHELLENLINKVFIQFKQRFNNECKNDGNTEEERSLRASAWYMIPFDLNQDCGQQYYGFAWTITEEICKLMKKSNNVNCFDENHDCLKSTTDLIDNYFKDNYVYKEPEIDESITDESDRRQIIMSERCKTAEVVIKAWLERQDHLFFKRKIGKRVISSSDSSMSDMDRKLRRKLMSIRIDVLNEARNELTKPLRSAGNLVMSFMKDSYKEWLSLNHTTSIIDTPIVKFGFSALITINHFFKTRSISHIIDLSPRFRVSLEAPIKESTFYISLPTSEKFYQCVKYIVQNNDEFILKMKHLSGAIEITLEPYPCNTKKLNHYYLLTASGTFWSLQAIKNFISHPSFFKTIIGKQWRKRNLLCRGMPDWRTQSNPLTTSLITNSN